METSKIDSNILAYYLQHVHGFLIGPKKTQSFPGVAKDIEEVLVKITGHDTFFPCQGFDDDCKSLLAEIKTELNKHQNDYEIACTFRELEDGTKALVYTKNKITTFKQPLPLRKPNSKASTKKTSPDTISTSFKLSHLNATLKFVKDDSTLTLRYPDMASEQADFILNMFKENNTEATMSRGFKTMYAPLWEAMKMFGIKYKFTLRYSEPKDPDMKCLVLDKIPIISKSNKQNQDQPPDTPASILVTFSTDNNRQITSTNTTKNKEQPPSNEESNKTNDNNMPSQSNAIVTQAYNEKLNHEANAATDYKYPTIIEALTNLDPDRVTEILKKIHTFVMDEESASLMVDSLTLQEMQICRSYRNLCCKQKFVQHLNGEGKFLARQITRKLEECLFKLDLHENKFALNADGKIRKCRKLRDTMMHSITFRKAPLTEKRRESALKKLKQKEQHQLQQRTATKNLAALSSKINIKPATISANFISSDTSDENKIVQPTTTSPNTSSSVTSDENKIVQPATTSANTSSSVTNDKIVQPATTSANTSSSVTNDKIVQPATTSANTSSSVTNDKIVQPATTSANTSSSVTNDKIVQPATTSANTSSSVTNDKIVQPATTSANTSSSVTNDKIVQPATTSANTSSSVTNDKIVQPATTSANTSKNVASGNNTNVKPAASFASGNNVKQKLIEGLNQPVNSAKAMKMMMNMGWSGGGLGARGKGITEPITPGIKRYLDANKRIGLGGKQGQVPRTRAKLPPKPPPILSKKEYHARSLQLIYKLLMNSEEFRVFELPECAFENQWKFLRNMIQKFNNGCNQDMLDPRLMNLVKRINQIMENGSWFLMAEAFNGGLIVVTKKQTVRIKQIGNAAAVYSRNGRTMRKLQIKQIKSLIPRKPVMLPSEKKEAEDLAKPKRCKDCAISKTYCDFKSKENVLKTLSSIPFSFKNEFIHHLILFCERDIDSDTVKFPYILIDEDYACVAETIKMLNRGIKWEKIESFEYVRLFGRIYNAMTDFTIKYKITSTHTIDLEKIYNEDEDDTRYFFGTKSRNEFHNYYRTPNDYWNTYISEYSKEVENEIANGNKEREIIVNGKKYNSIEDVDPDVLIRSVNKINNEIHMLLHHRYLTANRTPVKNNSDKYTNNTSPFKNNSDIDTNNTSLPMNNSGQHTNNTSPPMNNSDQDTNNTSPPMNNSDEDTNSRSSSVNNSDIDTKNRSSPMNNSDQDTHNSSQDISDIDQDMEDTTVVATDDEDDLLNSDDDITKGELAKEFEELKELFDEEKFFKIESDDTKSDLNNKIEVENIEEEQPIKTDEEVPAKEEFIRGPSPGKRSRADSECSNQESKKSKHYTKEIAILPHNYPEGKITEEKAREIQIAIRNSIDNDDSSELPLLKCDGLQNGMLLYCCHSEKSFKFIEELFNKTDLKIIHGIGKDKSNSGKNKEECRIRLNLRINSYFVENSESTLKRLVKYNKGLNTKGWKVIERLNSSECDVFLIEMDLDSYNYIREADFSLFAGIDKAVFSHNWD